MARVLLVTVGSLGDLHPYLAIAKVLRAAGHAVSLATHEHYREIVERAGAQFVAFPPSAADLPPESEWVPKVNHPTKGSEFVVRELIIRFLDQSYVALLGATKECDLIVSHLMAFAVPIAAEKRGIPWVSCLLQPSVIFSVDDPPILGPMPFLPKVRRLGPWVVRAVYALIRQVSHSWFRPVAALRAREGLPPAKHHPLINAFSPHGNWILFPEAFASPQFDWPVPRDQLGFPLFDSDGRTVLTDDVARFLEAGEPPVVFTLGSAVSESETKFFREAYEAVRANEVRSIFVAGAKFLGVPDEARKDVRVLVTPYAPFSKLFPRARALVHQCGIGTTGQALASGRPQLCVPFAHDQPDNAARVARLGAGVVLPSAQLGKGKMAGALRWLLVDPRFEESARRVAPAVSDGGFAMRLELAVAKVLAPRSL